MDASLSNQLGNIGEFVGSIGVVISLMFLVVQVRNGVRTARAATLQEIQRDMRELLGGGVDRASIAVRMRRGEPVSDEERLIHGQWSLMLFRAYETQWFHVRSGTLDGTLHVGYLQHLRLAFSNPYVESQWRLLKAQMFHPIFVDEVDEFIRANPPSSQPLHTQSPSSE